MGNELTGILAGTGAKMKGEVFAGHVSFRGALKADVAFEDLVAEARGTLLILSFSGNTVELGAGARASQLASQIRSPPPRLDRLRIDYGMRAAIAGPLEPTFRNELAVRAVVEAGIPKQPVDALFFAAETVAALAPLPKLAPLVQGTLWVVAPKQALPAATLAAAAKGAGLRVGDTVRFSATHTATALQR